jgi:hypothetical protein
MKKMRWVGHMGHLEENRNAYRVENRSSRIGIGGHGHDN